MLVAVLIIVLGLLWTLTSLAPKSAREDERRASQQNTQSSAQAPDSPLGASVGDFYNGEFPSPPPPPPSFIF